MSLLLVLAWRCKKKEHIQRRWKPRKDYGYLHVDLARLDDAQQFLHQAQLVAQLGAFT